MFVKPYLRSAAKSQRKTIPTNARNAVLPMEPGESLHPMQFQRINLGEEETEDLEKY
jgi:hypothetical protein